MRYLIDREEYMIDTQKYKRITHLDETTGQEEGLVAALLRVLVQLLGAEVAGVPIRIVVLSHFAAQIYVLSKAHPIGVLFHDVAGVDLGIVVPLVGVNFHVVLPPLLAGVVGLAAGGGVVAALLEPVVHPQPLLDEGLPRVVLVFVTAGDAGPDAGPDGRARRVADGRAGVGVGEGHAHGRDAVEIGSEGLLVALGRVLVEVSHLLV